MLMFNYTPVFNALFTWCLVNHYHFTVYLRLEMIFSGAKCEYLLNSKLSLVVSLK